MVVTLRSRQVPLRTPPTAAQLLDLRWLLSMLVPGGAETEPAPTVGYRRRATYAALPNFGNSRILLPTATRPAAAGLLRLREGSWRRSQRAQLLHAAATRALGLGALQPLLLDRVEVLERPGITPQERAAAHLEDRLTELLGQPVVLGAAVGRRDPHQSQVIYALSPAGAPVGFVKVAWNPLTRRLLHQEAQALRHWSARPRRRVHAPGLLHHGPWGPFDILITAPLDIRPGVVASRSAPPDPAVTREIADAGERGQAPLAESAYWTDLTNRALELTAADDDGRLLLTDTIDRLKAVAGSVLLEFGGWHGDWLPWNFCPRNGHLMVWDWEYWSPCAPLGFDLLHFYYGTAFYADRADAVSALRRTERDGLPALAALGVDAAAARVVYALFVVETVLRRLDIKVHGGGVDDDRIFPGVATALRESTERLEAVRGRS